MVLLNLSHTIKHSPGIKSRIMFITELYNNVVNDLQDAVSNFMKQILSGLSAHTTRASRFRLL